MTNQSFPKDWKLLPLQEIGHADWGNTAITKGSYRESGYQAYSASGPDGFVEWFEHDHPGVVISAIGAQCGKAWLAYGKWTPIKNTIWFSCDEEKADIRYAYLATSNPEFWPKAGQAQPFIAVGSVRNAIIPLPPTVGEQKAIAKALSDIDDLIASLDALIAKKRDIKHGAMQQLLTGKGRLPGFSGGWSKSRLLELCSFITKGATPTTYGFGWQKNGVLFLRSECVSERGLNLTQSNFISEKAAHFFRRGEVVGGDVLITITGNVGRVVLLSKAFGNAIMNQHIARIRVLPDRAFAPFIYYYLSQRDVRDYFVSIVTGQAYPQISLKQVRDTEILMPNYDEQMAIANVLTDLDSEILLAEGKLNKLNEIRQGMMQQLLTGRIRLA